EAPMQKFVEIIMKSKYKRFRTTAPFSKNCTRAMSLGIYLQEACYPLGRILPISIHNHYGVADGGLVYVYPADRDCSLVAKIAAQTQRLYSTHSREASLEAVMIASLHRAIIDQNNLDGIRIGRNGLIKASN